VGRSFAWLVLIACACSVAGAADVEKKFRFGFSIGGYNNTDEISSDAANELTLVDEDQVFAKIFIDPRDDSAVFGNLDIKSSGIATISAQYAVTQVFIVEASVGYTRADVGDIEVQAQFRSIDIPDMESFNFAWYRIAAGELERIPLQFTALARFRPRASFNPYVGGGIGYSFIGFEPSDELNQLSINMDSSLGGQTRLTEATYGSASLALPPASQIGPLTGATIDARDTFEWHIAGGAELSFKRNWSAYVDLRWTFASRTLQVGFNGGDYLGVPVPQWTDYVDSPAATKTYGAIQITSGGLLDGGSIQLRPAEGESPDTDCVANPQDCEQYFDKTMPDGLVDPGFYYAQGGSLDYGGIALQFGIRYTF
jgi:opacity protein-like surface antigen